MVEIGIAKEDAAVYNSKLDTKKSYEKIPTILCILVMIDMLSGKSALVLFNLFDCFCNSVLTKVAITSLSPS